MFKKQFQITKYSLLFCCLLYLSSCATEQDEEMFRRLDYSHTNINFTNKITETADLNILNFHYIYNGGGVGVGDFDKNGLPDVVFSGNQVDSKIYLNKGDLSFEDITEFAHFETDGWATGVSIVDINSDGWQDVYLSVGGYDCDGNCNNQLFVHQGLNENGIPTFKELAESYGLQDGLYTQQAAFFDYDSDGDLDVYLLHNVIDDRDKNAPSKKQFINKRSKDQLLENNGQGFFVNRSDALGIDQRGYGLGITINDFNNDLLPDIYIANDFLSDDFLYLNQGTENGQHKGFKEVGHQLLKHTSYNAMGVDVADVNNDALPDIFVLDMLPEYNERQKSMLGFMNYSKFLMTLKQGYAPQFVRNTLQIHNGFLEEEMLPFSEVAYLSGVCNTDWSWAPLLADFDNDGDRDLYVTNGYGKDITDLDFINYTSQISPFSTKETRQRELYEATRKMESVKMSNYIFENDGNLKFKNQSGNWTKKQKTISNGAAYADLDNDGDLDLLVNNIDESAFVLENRLTKTGETNFLKIELLGPKGNLSGIGTKIFLWVGGKEQVHYQSPVRSYLSSVDDLVHFGLGKHQKVDSLMIVYPSEGKPGNGTTKKIKNVPANQTIEVYLSDLKDAYAFEDKKQETIFKKNEENPIEFMHQENFSQDFDAQPLLLHQHSKQGPCFASANIDGALGEELFIGGAKGFPSQIFAQNDLGAYESKILLGKEYEDSDAAFFDFDQDGDLDLYVVSGGTEFKKDAPEFEDRLYLNDGKGNFEKSVMALPKSSGSCVLPNDFDKDGDIDLFVGGRVIPQMYPETPKSVLLINDNGTFIEDSEINKVLANIGMVSDATWADYDGDGWDDLIFVGEWMPVTICRNTEGTFEEKGKVKIQHSAGLYNCIETADFDKDGDLDFMLGNLGENSRLQASPNEPIALYKKDYDQNGSYDPLIGQYYQNEKGERKCYPLHSRDDAMKQIVKLKNRYLKYSDFGMVTFPELMQSELDSEDYLFANFLQSVYLENQSNGQFELRPLPQAAQLAPIQKILVEDFDQDGHLDALLSGNDFTSEKNNGWYDAFNGLFLKGDGKGDFQSVSTTESGFYVPFDGRDIIQVSDNKGRDKIFVGQNSNWVLEFIW